MLLPTATRGFFATVLVAAVLAGSAFMPQVAGAQPEDDGRHLVGEFLRNVETLSADFSQSLIDASGTIVEESTGTLSIARPGRFRWAYRTPYEQLLVADGLNIWSYDVDLAQVTVKPQSEALANTPALLLGGSAEVLDDFSFEGSRMEGGLTWVQMSPQDTQSGFSRVDLGFVEGQLSRMVFLDNLEQTTVVALENVVVNEAADVSIYDFEVPADVDVVGTPAVHGQRDG